MLHCKVDPGEGGNSTRATHHLHSGESDLQVGSNIIPSAAFTISVHGGLIVNNPGDPLYYRKFFVGLTWAWTTNT